MSPRCRSRRGGPPGRGEGRRCGVVATSKGACGSPEHFVFHDAAEYMRDRDVPLLDPLRVVRGDDDGDVDEVLGRAAPLAEEPDDRHPFLLRLDGGTIDVL